MNKPLLDSTVLYERYRVTLKIREKLFGGVPKNPDLIEAWVKARTGYDDELTKAQTKEALETQTEEIAAGSGMWTGFASDDVGIFLHTRNVKAMFRESSTLLGITQKKRGSKQIIQHGFEVKGCVVKNSKLATSESHVYFMKDDNILAVPDGSEEGPIHVMTAQGPRTALKRQDFVEEAMLAFDVWILKTESAEKRHLGEKDLHHMLTHAQENGLGASRSQGNGKFDVIEISRLDK